MKDPFSKYGAELPDQERIDHLAHAGARLLEECPSLTVGHVVDLLEALSWPERFKVDHNGKLARKREVGKVPDQEQRIAILSAFLKAFPQADSSEITISTVNRVRQQEYYLLQVPQVDWLDPKRDSIAPRTFDVIIVKNGDRVSYAFQEV